MADLPHTPTRDDAEPLAPSLRDAVAMLRDAAEPSVAWRAGVVAAATGQGARRRAYPARRVMWIALAAGLGGVLLGGGGAWMAMRAVRDSAPLPNTPLASTPSGGVSTVHFTLVAPQAERVSVVGDFNHWDPARTPLRRDADGRRWEITIPLAPGRYEYSFLVDGVLATDPSAPRAPGADFGAPNSIVFVRGSW